MQDFEERGLPTLHFALESALTKVSSVLLTKGAICSAVVKHNNGYMFFILILMVKMISHQVTEAQF